MSKLPYIVGLLFLFSCSVVSNTFAISWAIAKLLCPGDFPGKNTGVGCHFLLQGIFTTQGSNPHLFMSPALAGDNKYMYLDNVSDTRLAQSS